MLRWRRIIPPERHASSKKPVLFHFWNRNLIGNLGRRVFTQVHTRGRASQTGKFSLRPFEGPKTLIKQRAVDDCPTALRKTTLGGDRQIHPYRTVCLYFALMEITIRKENASDFVVQSKL